MSRTVAVIQKQIIDTIASDPNMVYTDENNIVRNITYNTSNRAMWRAWTHVVAVCVAILEQLMDVYQASIEVLVAKSAAASSVWIQSKMFDFQYDLTTPQIVQLINTIPVYPNIDPTKRITTACAVSVNIANTVKIKVAKSNPFQAFDSLQLASAQDYIDTIGDAGIDYNVISLDADRLLIEANIYFKGQYSAIISKSVIDMLNAYLQNNSITNFDGALKMSDLENVIRSVDGVLDVVLINVYGRANTASPPPATNYILIQNQTLVNRLYNPVAGYMVQEDTTGYTFSDTLTFIAQ